MKIIAVTQSNYIPWKGYFHTIDICDHVIFLDDVQYTRRDWRNRNQIKTPQGLKWLTIPVDVKGKYADLRICDVKVSDSSWVNQHWNMIHQNYRKAPFFKEVEQWLKPLYDKASNIDELSKINHLFISEICSYLEIKTEFSWSSDYFSFEELDHFSSTERLLKLCQKQNATDYISGPAAKSYFEMELFQKENINVIWADYSQYPEYQQLNGDFVHGVSIIDMLMMLGTETKKYFK